MKPIDFAAGRLPSMENEKQGTLASIEVGGASSQVVLLHPTLEHTTA